MNGAATTSPIRVLVVEDSPSQRAFLLGLLQSDPGFEVAGTASNGNEAVLAAQNLRPHVIAMDILLPELDGYEATRRIMQVCPTPIVMISSDDAAAQRSVEALAVGALSVVRKPSALGSSTHAADRKSFLTTLRLMAGVPVVTRYPPRLPLPASLPRSTTRRQILALAASTGGPFALQMVLRGLEPSTPLPILVVQHITRGFTTALVEWLNSTLSLPVEIARSGALARPGHVYIAPDDQHLMVQPGGVLALRPASSGDRFCPSADVLFQSVARVYRRSALAVVLTGMGDDGARGMQELAAAGGITLAQDEASCVVYGMPGAAVAAGAVTRIVPLDEMAGAIRRLLGDHAEPQTPGG
jgi:two-component system, chemotaxis family, protein-glutamate methylesterase/glutaminase